MALISTKTIADALETSKPGLIQSYKNIVTCQFNRIIGEFGPAAKGVANSTSYKVWANTVRPCTITTKVAGDLSGIHSTYSIDEGKLNVLAQKYADAVVEAWILKIVNKLGELDTAEAIRFNGETFFITGTKNGHNVVIQQDRIINVSSLGKLFHQFPARITLNGKSMSEAKYKKAIAA